METIHKADVGMKWVETQRESPTKRGYYVVSWKGDDWSWAFFINGTWLEGAWFGAPSYNTSPMYWADVVPPLPNKTLDTTPTGCP
jgi:hypothetical protein